MNDAFSNIAAALDVHLSGLTDAPPIAWENVEFTPPNDSAWIRPTMLPGDTVQGSMGDDGYNEYQGLYQVSVFTPRGIGRGKALTLADDVAEHFARGTTLTANGQEVRIGVASRQTAILEDAWYHIPVEIGWRAHANP